MEAGTPRRARGSKFPPPREGESPGASAPRGGGDRGSPPCSRVAGERNPVAVATVSKRTGGGLRPAPASWLTGAFPLSPCLPPFLRCGLGEGPAGAGVRGGDPGPGRGAARGEGLSPGIIFRPRSGPTGPPPRYSRAQASSSSSSSWLGASGTGPADRARDPGEAAAAPGNGLWQRRRLRELGWSRGARARARTRRVPSPACARAAAGRGPPPPVSRRRGCCPGSERLRTRHPPAAPRLGRQGAGFTLHRECPRHAAQLLATCCPDPADASRPGAHRRRLSTQDAQPRS